MIRSVLTLFGIGAFYLSGYGQLSESDSLRRSLLINASGNLSYGNVNRQFLLSTLQYVHHVGNSIALKTQNSHRYGQRNGGVIANDLLAFNYVYYRPQNRFYPYAVFFVEKSRRKKIDDRWLGGVGLTYQAARSKQFLMKLSVTMLYEANDYEENEFKELGTRSTTLISMPRVSFRLFGRHNFQEIPLQIYYVGRLNRSLSSLGDYRLTLGLGVDINLTKVLAFTARADYNREDIVVFDRSADDLLMTYGLRVLLTSVD